MKYIGFTVKIPLGIGKIKIELLNNSFRSSLAHKLSKEYGIPYNNIYKVINDFHRWWFKKSREAMLEEYSVETKPTVSNERTKE